VRFETASPRISVTSRSAGKMATMIQCRYSTRIATGHLEQYAESPLWRHVGDSRREVIHEPSHAEGDKRGRSDREGRAHARAGRLGHARRGIGTDLLRVGA